MKGRTFPRGFKVLVVLQIQGGQVYPKGTKKPIYPMPKWKNDRAGKIRGQT